jgi:phosphoserine phosphatase
MIEPNNIVSTQQSRPIIIDLDGTLIYSDMFHESALKFFCKNPLRFLGAVFLLAKSKAALKAYFAQNTSCDPSTLPYNQELILWLKDQKKTNRKLILCTGSHISIANSIAQFLGFFDEVIGTTHTHNLTGKNKAIYLERRFGEGGFDYAGNSNSDVFVWGKAHHGISVNASKNVIKSAQQVCNVVLLFPKKSISMKHFIKMLRVHQWVKNILIFAPLIAAHQFNDWHQWLSLCLAFIAFSLCASSVYITNDLFDLASDRKHIRKKLRPFANGTLPLWLGAILAPMLFVCGITTASYINPTFMIWVMIYYIITCAYSYGLKRLVLIDCIALAILYTIRIIAGASAIHNELSFWLLAFSTLIIHNNTTACIGSKQKIYEGKHQS